MHRHLTRLLTVFVALMPSRAWSVDPVDPVNPVDPLDTVFLPARHDDKRVDDLSGYEIYESRGAPALAVADPAGGAWRFETFGLIGGRCSGGGELEALGGQPLLVRVTVDVELSGTDDCVTTDGNLECPCTLRREHHLYAIDRFTGAILGSRIVVVAERWPDSEASGRSQMEIGGRPAQGAFATLVRGVEDPRTSAARADDIARLEFDRGVLARAEGNFTTAIQRFSRAIAANPWYPRAWANRGATRLRANVDLEAGLRDLEIALLLDDTPAFASVVWFDIGAIHRALNDAGKARRAFARCAALGNAACKDARPKP